MSHTKAGEFVRTVAEGDGRGGQQADPRGLWDIQIC